MPSSLSDASNSIKSSLTFRCSMRLPPTLKKSTASTLLTSLLLSDASPYNSHLSLSIHNGGDGFDTAPLNPNLASAFFDATSLVFNGSKPLFLGCGGSIPFMSFFSEMFPQVNFLLTGCGFPDCGAHSANEHLVLEYCRKVTEVIALTISMI